MSVTMQVPRKPMTYVGLDDKKGFQYKNDKKFTATI
jgi:hypothetical protein